MPRPQIRQNPDYRGSNRSDGPGTVRPEWCPIHGTYTPPRAWLNLRRRAVSGKEKPGRAAMLLEAAARVRRRCRHGPHQSPTGPKWAEQIRFKIEKEVDNGR